MLKKDTAEETTEKSAAGWGPVVAVAAAFFVAEMGDKTQLAAISLTVKYGQPFMVLAGATLAMTVADGLGVVAGSLLWNRIPPSVLHRAAAALFGLFGIIGIYQAAAARFAPVYAIAITGAAAVITLVAAVALTRLSGYERE
jgi:putative Ca2+/H+ antiporter (TMEM165/GDT1 family)